MKAAALLGVAVLGLPLAAQEGGVLGGIVTDQRSGDPVPNAQVLLEPGGRGAVSGPDGRYLVRELRPGLYRVTVRAVGFGAVVRDSVQVSGAGATVLDFRLVPTAVVLEGITVAERIDPLLNPRLAQTSQTVTARELRELPVTTVDEAIALQAGVVEGSFRGGRPGEETLVVDGLGVKNQLDAASGVTGLRIPAAALEEASVVTNGFSARYGQALSGVINITTRDGGDRLAGSLGYETDRPFGNGWDVGLDRLIVTAEGPLVGGARFLAVADARARIDDDPVAAPPAADPLDPRATSPWLLPHNTGEHFDLFGKVTVPLGPRMTLRTLGLFSLEHRQLFDPEVKYRPDRGPAQAVDGRLLSFHLQHVSGPTAVNPSILDLRVGWFDKEAIRAPLLARPVAQFGAFTFGGFDFAGAAIARARDSAAAQEAIAGFEPPAFASETPWGVPAFFYTDSRRGELAWNRFRELRMRADAFFGRGTDTDFRLGAEVVRQSVATFTRLESYRSVALGAPSARVASFEPVAGAAYGEWVQRFGDLTLTAGLRADAFDARGAGEDASAGTKFALGPRFAVSTVLEQATVVASFGRFAQAPDYQYLVDAAFDDTLRTGRFRRGNPNLGFETSTQYEMQVRFRPTPWLGVRVGAFQKRLDGLISSLPVGFDPDSALFGNGDYGVVRGLELGVEREMEGVVGARISYVLQDAQATASNALDFFRRLRIDPLGDTVVPAVVTFPMDYDRRHALTALIRLRTPAGAPRLVRGVELGLVGRYLSGLPYSRTNLTGDSLLGLPNAHRLPDQRLLDVRLARTGRVAGLDLTAWLDVRNLFNRRTVLAVRRDTGEPEPGEAQIRAMALGALQAHPEPIPYESPRYRGFADLDGDGILQGPDELLPLFERAARDLLQPLFAYGPPRLVRLGLQVGF